jgi:hypothetical protein
MRGDRPLLRRLAVAPVALPHELGHAVVAAAAGLPYTVTLLPSFDGPVTPLGRFDADIDRTTPCWQIRLVAVAPLPLFVGLAAAVGALSLPAPVGIVVWFLCAVWASLSAGDLAVAAAPEAARRAGAFTVALDGWEPRAADLLTLVTALVVGVLVLG